MKLKGIVEITVHNENGISYQNTQENLIPDNSWVEILGTNAFPNYFGSRRISISTSISTPVATNNQVANVIGTCAQLSPPVYIENVDPPFGTIFGQIAPVGITRVFSTVALTALAAGNVQVVASTTAYAVLLLLTPCTQGPSDFVTISYFIQFVDAVGDTFPNKKLNRYDLGRCLMGFGTYNIGSLGAFPCTPLPLSAMSDIPSSIVRAALPPAYASQTLNALNFKWNYQLLADVNTLNGVIFNGMSQGIANDSIRGYAITKYPYDKDPIQTGFKQSASGNNPFFDSSNIASGQGTATMSGTWTGKFPETYRITYTTGGDVGTSAYRISLAKHIGYQGNTFTCADVNSIYRTPGVKYAPTLHGWRNEDFDIHRLDNTRVVQYDLTGVSVVDIMSGVLLNFDSASLPLMPCTNIRQVAVDTINLIVYVACRDTGLWTIDILANTSVNTVTTPCFGVDVGRLNIAVAIFNGSIRRSTNWATLLPFTYSNITADWARVRFLKSDPQHPNDRIAILADNGAGVNQIVWHQFSDNVSVAGGISGTPPSIGALVSYPASLDVSDTGSTWMVFRFTNDTNQILLTSISYGTSVFGTQFSAFGLTISPSPSYIPVFANQIFSKISFFQDSALGGFSLVGGTTVLNYPDFPTTFGRTQNTSFAIFMDSGIIICTNFMRQIFTGNALFWTEYGWDGAAWVPGNTNSKTTQLTADPLINGLTIAFTNGASPPHFISGEKQIQGVNNGILKDNATTLELRTAWYSKPIRNEVIPPTSITASLNLPCFGNPLFRRVDTDSFQGHRFFINGVAATKVWLDGTAPAVSEVSILTNGSATITFNVSDVGKTLTGNYIWIEI
jgi:hypothetical protein